MVRKFHSTYFLLQNLTEALCNGLVLGGEDNCPLHEVDWGKDVLGCGCSAPISLGVHWLLVVLAEVEDL